MTQERQGASARDPKRIGAKGGVKTREKVSGNVQKTPQVPSGPAFSVPRSLNARFECVRDVLRRCISDHFAVVPSASAFCSGVPANEQGSATNQHPSNHSGESVHFLIPCHPPFLFAYEVIGMPQFLSAEPPHLSRALPARCKNHSRMPKAVSV